MRALFSLAILFFFLQHTLTAQTTCIVNIDSLKGEYNGDCKKGKADGKGTATGINSYTGDFKNGYPDGQGKYTWKNGSWYEGSWKNGLFEGQGTLNAQTGNNPDSSSVTTGFWKKGKYIGKYEKPYLIRALTNNINEATIRKADATELSFTITAKSISGSGVSLSNPTSSKPQLVDVQLVKGRFEQKETDENSSSVSTRYIFRNVTFPFYAIFSFEMTSASVIPVQKVAIELNESGSYTIQVNINN